MPRYVIMPDEKFISKVRPVVARTLKKCEKFLKPRKPVFVNITFTNDYFITRRMRGSTGWLDDNNVMNLAANTKAKNWAKGVEASVAHEFNHIVRLEVMRERWQKVSLREQIALDGLAQCFEEEITGQVPPHARAISKKKAVFVWKSMRPHLSSSSYELFEKMFFGGSKQFPTWAGYTVSYIIIKNKIEELDVEWPALMRMDAKKLVGNGMDSI